MYGDIPKYRIDVALLLIRQNTASFGENIISTGTEREPPVPVLRNACELENPPTKRLADPCPSHTWREWKIPAASVDNLQAGSIGTVFNFGYQRHQANAICSGKYRICSNIFNSKRNWLPDPLRHIANDSLSSTSNDKTNTTLLGIHNTTEAQN